MNEFKKVKLYVDRDGEFWVRQGKKVWFLCGRSHPERGLGIAPICDPEPQEFAVVRDRYRLERIGKASKEVPEFGL